MPVMNEVDIMANNAVFPNDFYVISKDFRLVRFNDSVARTYRGIKVGDYCYKATMNRDTPCLHCPIAGHTDNSSPVYYDPFYKTWVEAIFSDIGEGQYAVTCRPVSDRGQSLISEAEAREKQSLKCSGQDINRHMATMLRDRDSRNAILRAASSIYYILYDVDIVHDTFTEVYTCDAISAISSRYASAQQCFQLLSQSLFVPEDRNAAGHFYDMGTWQERLRDCAVVHAKFRGVSSGWTRNNLIVAERDEAGNVTHVLVAVQDIDLEQRKVIEMEERQKMHLEIIEALSRDFQNVYIVDLQQDTIRAQKQDGRIVDASLAGQGSYSDFCASYVAGEIHPEDAPTVLLSLHADTIAHRLAGADDYAFTCRTVSGGVTQYMQVKCARFPHSSNIILGLRNIDAIIGDEKRATALLRETNSSLSALLDREKRNTELVGSISSLFFAMYQLDLQSGTIQEIVTRGSMHERLGRQGDARERLRLSIEEFATPEYRPALRNFHDMATIAGRLGSKSSISEEFVSENGSWTRAIMIASERGEDGDAVKVLYVLQDISAEKDALTQERQKALAEAAKSAEGMNILYEVIGSAKWTMDFNSGGHITAVHWSDEFRRLHGYSSTEDFPNEFETWFRLVHPDDQEKVRRAFRGAVDDYTGETTYDVRYRVNTRDKGWKWFRAAGRLSRRPDGSPVTYYGICSDIDTQVRMEEQIAAQKKALQDAVAVAQYANNAKTLFLNNMSHDIRTPMNAIIGFTALAASHLDNREQVSGYLAKIATSSQHLLALINDVLDMSRIESGKFKLEQQQIHLPDILHDLRTIIVASITAKNIDFFIDTVDIVNEDIVCDRLRLNQILLNLLSNAAKFTRAGGAISLRVLEKPSRRAGYANFEFRVKDNGIGMSEEFQKHVFEAFTREENSTVSGIQGTGLGMAITKNIVDMMGGTISVTSQEGRGTEFIVSFSFETCSSNLRQAGIPHLEGVRALVADDDANTAVSVSKMLSKIGMRPDWTLSGKEAVLRTQVSRDMGDCYGVFIIDWKMPDMNGIETARQIRATIG
ncbi:MAG: ATP-binding protein, partial [Desulfovibrionaceae bacterium]